MWIPGGEYAVGEFNLLQMGRAFCLFVSAAGRVCACVCVDRADRFRVFMSNGCRSAPAVEEPAVKSARLPTMQCAVTDSAAAAAR